MPPRKKIVKKAVRKAKSKAQTPPPPSDEPESVPESSTPAANDGGATVPSATDADAAVPDVSNPANDAPYAEETAASEPISNVTLEPQQPDAATETIGKEPEPAAVDTSLVEETPAIEPAGSGEASVEERVATETLDAEPTASEASEEPLEVSKKKTVTRVRKVVKKKIVTKLVPKTAIGTKEESKVTKEDDEGEEEEEAEASQPDEKQHEVENLSSGDASAPTETAMVAEDAEEEDVEKAEGAKDVEKAEGVENVEKAEDAVNVEHAEKAEDGLKTEEKGHDLEMEVAGDEQAAVPESSNSRKKTEIFIGGLDRDAKEEDLRKVFGEVGEIVEVRMIMDGQSGKNKGYAFLRYAEASQAKKAVAQFEKVEVLV